MPFSALQIKDYSPLLGTKYLFDANAWIFILEADLELRGADRRAEHYVALLEKIKLAGSPKPKVVLPAVVLSEVVNRLIRNYYYPLFIKEHKTLVTSNEGENYKKVYRPHNQYNTDYSSILYNIKSYHNILELIDDHFSKHDTKSVFTKPDTTLDFNDYVIAQIAIRNQYILVSDDSDFAGKDLTVVTGNRDLLNWKL